MTRQTLRKILIALAIASAVVAVLQIGSQIYMFSNQLNVDVNIKYQRATIFMIISGFFSAVQPLAIGALCLFAADQIKPFKSHSNDGETND